jgi:hypothetical protein
MGWQMYSRTEISGDKAILDKLADLIRSDDLEKRFDTKRFCLPEVIQVNEDGSWVLCVVLSTRKRVPENFFEYCESLGCQVLADTDHESAAHDNGLNYNSETIQEERQAELEDCEKQLAEAREQLRQSELASNPQGEGPFSAGAFLRAKIQVCEEKLSDLRKKVSGDTCEELQDD